MINNFNLKGYRTIIVNLLTFIVLGGAAVINGPSNLSPTFLAYAGLVVTLANIGLRIITDTPVGKSTPDPLVIPDVHSK